MDGGRAARSGKLAEAGNHQMNADMAHDAMRASVLELLLVTDPAKA